MKILHYSLGFYPYRTGGLTKYCMDLMLKQHENGHEVAMLWPGRINLIKKKNKVKKVELESGIISFELINPLPVSLDEGIKSISSYIAIGDVEFYKNFIKSFNPDIIHLHTLMGIHKEFIVAANELKIKTIFTTHDYFGICPKVTLFYNELPCKNDDMCKKCIQCNEKALDIWKIVLMQSIMYRKLKDFKLIKMMRSYHRKEAFNNISNIYGNKCIEGNKQDNYKMLREYYLSILELIDMIHFNSTVSEKVYKKYLNPKCSKVINITHSNIKDRRIKKDFSNNDLILTYLSPVRGFKGFDILIKALDKLWNEGNRNFKLKVFSLPSIIKPYMEIRNGYTYDELEKIFEVTDMLVAPSIWYETFGFTVLEALSHGVPVIISENMGAKDLFKDEYGYIINANSDELYRKIKFLLKNKKDTLTYFNKNIIESFIFDDMNSIEKMLY